LGQQKSFFFSKWEVYQKEHPPTPKTSSSKNKPPKIYDCSTCSLAKKCHSPEMSRFGAGKKRILIVGLCPGRVEDRYGIPFVGPSGTDLRKMLSYSGIDLDKDCWRTNIVHCYPGADKKGKDKDPTDHQIKCCRAKLEQDILETNPELVICLGTPAIISVLQPQHLKKLRVSQLHGKVIPSQRYNCWVGCSYHPAFFRYRKQKKDKYPDDGIILGLDLANILSYLGEPIPKPLTSEGNKCVTDVEEVLEHLKHFSRSKKSVSYDYETTTLYPWEEGADILTMSITDKVSSAVFIPLRLKDLDGKQIFSASEQEIILTAWKEFLRSEAPKVVQNVNMEEMWNRFFFGLRMCNYIWDTMITANVINNVNGTTGLEFQAYGLTGHEYKGMVDIEHLTTEELQKVCDYNCWDSRYTLMSYYDQKSNLDFDKGLKAFNDCYTEGSKVLLNLRERGNKIDIEVLDELESKYLSEQKIILQKMKLIPGVKKYEEESGSEFNPDSATVQLQKILYEGYKIEKKRKTATEKGSTDQAALEEIAQETTNEEVKQLINSLLRYRKTCSLTERVANYRNVMDKEGYVHPSYNQNTAVTYRSSANDPNIQNIFKRDEELQVFRKAIVPSPGHLLLEVDYSGMETRVIGMHSRDRELIRQIQNDIDLHSKWGARVLMKTLAAMTKQDRYRGKNSFNFPSFYGSIATSVARSFPEIPKEHVIKTQKEFWEEYREVKEWQNRVIHDYLKKGYVRALFGWKRIGPLSINQLYNNIIQGDAFLILLDSLIRVDKELTEKGFKTEVTTEVHDSMDFDAHPDEIEDVIRLVSQIMCSCRYDWQEEVPLAVEWEIGRNWYSMYSIQVTDSEVKVKVDKDNVVSLKEFIAQNV